MSSTTAHYDDLLAPVYLWMAGGLDHALALGTADIADLQGRGGLAVDLGAGFGMHAIPLARAGFRVAAIDGSAFLVDQLRGFAAGLDVEAQVGDLLEFPQRLLRGRRADVIVCMGDTLTHLSEAGDVDRLARRVAQALAPGGRFMATFRDYTQLPQGPARFIPVRSDADRLLTCFLEAQAEHVQVHDLLHERHGGQWALRVGSYRKLRLSPPDVARAFEAAGLTASVAPGPRGMVRLVADAAPATPPSAEA